ncbi:hypothetical protein PPL_07645 [Heterostelium album PN500]|uniref:Uncharacterized protein n=1 Tax=Heterostelium pallidum (strain ATCC 26659 / Pp 5 / PN500) TaxID=670386 RepID=D3BGJ3_HETP5|nr:hypothetical protein PPL_07645 [Heterostelium album PN500]EFA79227.1 hypothetical protein PPL_07645 [Heterostelium album PN500]|eukprot:XP_020431348.1 hypothetical protein PPL_07645 [Heterostelium album PN500]
MSIDLNQLIKTIRERDIRKVLNDYKDRNELINDLFDVLNSNFTKKQVVEDCFFVLNQIDSQEIWNDLTLTTKIELQSKSLDLLELECNYNINTIIIEFIKNLYHNHCNEIGPHFEFLIHYFINVLDITNEELQQLSEAELNQHVEIIKLTLTFIKILSNKEPIHAYTGQIVTQLFKLIDFDSFEIKEESTRLLYRLFKRTITYHGGFTDLDSKETLNKTKEYIQTLRQSIINKLQKSI